MYITTQKGSSPCGCFTQIKAGVRNRARGRGRGARDVLELGTQGWGLPGGIVLALSTKGIAQVVPAWTKVHHTANTVMFVFDRNNNKRSWMQNRSTAGF